MILHESQKAKISLLPSRLATDIMLLVENKHRELTPGERRKILVGIKDLGICQLCKLPIDDFKHLTVDHIIPRSQKGTLHVANIQAAHSRCNGIRRDRPLSECPPESFINFVGKKTAARKLRALAEKSKAPSQIVMDLRAEIVANGIEHVPPKKIETYFKKYLSRFLEGKAAS